MTPSRIVIRSATVIDGAGGEPRRADVAVERDTITIVGEVAPLATDEVIDGTGRLVAPGFIDTHSHADGAVFRPEVQRALLRQGVTTVITGQDGVSYAPGDGAYASDYFAALNGPHPTYEGGGVGALLASYDDAVAVNVGYLVPAGTVRHEVMGYGARAASDAEVRRMRDLVAEGMAQGALGLSSGLDYVPNIHQSTAELADLCRPVAAAGGLYVTHMRGGYETNSKVGIDEVAEIALATGVPVHVSHYHGPSQLLLGLLDDLASRGVDATFDAYPYRRGCTLLAMPLLPPAVLSGPRRDVVAHLGDPANRAELLAHWFPLLEQNPTLGSEWPDNLTLAHVAHPDYAWAHGLTVRAAAAQRGTTPSEFVLDVLVQAELEVSAVMRVRHARGYDDIAKLIRHPAHLGGSDGIFVGEFPHPRAWATFSRFVRKFALERADLTLTDLVWHLSGHAAQRFGLGDRGRVRPGFAADLILIDPEHVRDVASYENPRADSTGVRDVLVAGVAVLRDGDLTGATPGRGLTRSTPAL